MTVPFRAFFAVLTVLAVLSAEIGAAQEIEAEKFKPLPTAGDCTYLQNPDEFLDSLELHQADISKWTEMVGNQVKFSPVRSDMLADAAPAAMPRKNFIDD